MLASYTFRPRTSIHSRKVAVDFTFIYPLYRGRFAFTYRVLYIVAFYTFTAFFQRRFYLLSTYLAIYIVDLHLYQWPPILYFLSGTLLARHQFSAYYYSSSYIFLFLFSSLKAKGLLAYKLAPLGGPYSLYTIPRSLYIIQYPAYLLLYQVVLYYRYSLYSGCLYIYVYRQYYYFTLQYGAQYPFIGPYNLLYILVLQFL